MLWLSPDGSFDFSTFTVVAFVSASDSDGALARRSRIQKLKEQAQDRKLTHRNLHLCFLHSQTSLRVNLLHMKVKAGAIVTIVGSVDNYLSLFAKLTKKTLLLQKRKRRIAVNSQCAQTFFRDGLY